MAASKPQIAPKPKLSKPSLSLLEEIYAEIEDKHAKSSLLKTMLGSTSEYSSSSSSSSSSAYSSYSSAGSSNADLPPLPTGPPPSLVTPSLRLEIEREICAKFDTPVEIHDDEVQSVTPIPEVLIVFHPDVHGRIPNRVS